MNIKILVIISVCVLSLLIFPVFPQQIPEKTSVVQQIDPFEQAIKDSFNSDPYIRRQAAEQFGTLREPRAIPYLKKMLKDENPFVRQTAVDSLGLLRAKEVVDDIIDLLKIEKEPQVKQSAVVALGYIGDLSCVSALIEILKDEKEPNNVKYAVCNTLGVLRSTEPIPVLGELVSSNDLNLRRSAIYALGKISTEESISILRNALEKNIDNEQISIDLIKILADANDKSSIPNFKLLYSTTTTTAKTKFYAAYALAKVAKDQMVLPTIKLYLKSKDENIKNTAIDAIRFIGDRESLTILKELEKTEQSPYTKQLLSIAIKQLESKYPKSQQEKK